MTTQTLRLAVLPSLLVLGLFAGLVIGQRDDPPPRLSPGKAIDKMIVKVDRLERELAAAKARILAIECRLDN